MFTVPNLKKIRWRLWIHDGAMGSWYSPSVHEGMTPVKANSVLAQCRVKGQKVCVMPHCRSSDFPFETRDLVRLFRKADEQGLFVTRANQGRLFQVMAGSNGSAVIIDEDGLREPFLHRAVAEGVRIFLEADPRHHGSTFSVVSILHKSATPTAS